MDRASAVLLGLALVLGACGDDSGAPGTGGGGNPSDGGGGNPATGGGGSSAHGGGGNPENGGGGSSSGGGGNPSNGGGGSGQGGAGGDPMGGGGSGPMGSPFVSVDPAGPNFVVDGSNFYFVGSDNYTVPLMQAQGVACSATDACATSELDAMAASGVTVVRVYGTVECGGSGYINVADGNVRCTQNSPGNVYNESGLAALDHTVAEAKSRGMKVSLVLVSNWRDSGGMDQYVQWANLSHHDDFYTDAGIKSTFKGFVSHLLGRVNTVTGVAYADEDAIMSLDLADDPRCQGSVYVTSPQCSNATIKAWADEMAQYVKSIDSHHLVTLGVAGFVNGADGNYPNIVAALGAGSWAANGSSGDFTATLDIASLDYATYQWYPEYWSLMGGAFTAWATDHITAAAAHGKPAVVQFGELQRAIRPATFEGWLGTIDSMNGAGAIVKAVHSNPYPDYDSFGVFYPGDSDDVAARDVMLSYASTFSMK